VGGDNRMSVVSRVTPHLPKLIEAAARNCYNSFHLSKPDGHKLCKNLMNMPKPHLSIGHHGNVLICLTMPEDLTTKEIKAFPTALSLFLSTLQLGSHNYLTISTSNTHIDSRFDAVISGNIVAFKRGMEYVSDLLNSGSIIEGIMSDLVHALYEEVYSELVSMPETLFFLDKDEGYALMDNPYLVDYKELDKNKILIYDNYSDILTPEECDLHETATVVLRSARVIMEQNNRHEAGLSIDHSVNMEYDGLDERGTGISMLSQRYVLPFDLEGKKFSEFLSSFDQAMYDAIAFRYHPPVDIDPDEPIKLYLEHGDNRVDFDNASLLWHSEMSYREMMNVVKTFFFSIFFHDMMKHGMETSRNKRSNEIARSMLTNNMDTVAYYTRNKWRWRHYINLRTDAHTQLEQRHDSIPLLASFQKIGWFTDLNINWDKMIAEVKKQELQ
jgi:hypothetical protein